MAGTTLMTEDTVMTLGKLIQNLVLTVVKLLQLLYSSSTSLTVFCISFGIFNIYNKLC